MMTREQAKTGQWNALGKLRQAIIDNTAGDLFWIGEILLAELEKETGFPGWTDWPPATDAEVATMLATQEV